MTSMKNKIFAWAIITAAAMSLGGCANQKDAPKAPEDTSASFFDFELNVNQSDAYIDYGGFYSDFLKNEQYTWGKDIPLFDLNAYEQGRLSQEDRMYFNLILESGLNKDGYVGCLSGGIVWADAFFQGASQTVEFNEGDYTKEMHPRLYVAVLHLGGSCSLRFQDEKGEIFWEKNNITETMQEFITLEEMPENLTAYIQDETDENEADRLNYCVLIYGGVERNLLE